MYSDEAASHVAAAESSHAPRGAGASELTSARLGRSADSGACSHAVGAAPVVGRRSRSRSPAGRGHRGSRRRADSSSDGLSPSSRDSPGTARYKEKARKKMRKLQEKCDSAMIQATTAASQLQLAQNSQNSTATQAVKNTLLWEEVVKEPDMSDRQHWITGCYDMEDDGQTPERLNWEIRLKLLPPNSDPSTWWTSQYIGDEGLTARPVRGTR